MRDKKDFFDLMMPLSLATAAVGAVVYAYKRDKKKNSISKEIVARTQLLAVDYSEENLEEYIAFIQNKPLDKKELSCLIEAYHLLNSYDVDGKYISDIKLVLQMNGYMNPFKLFKKIEDE